MKKFLIQLLANSLGFYIAVQFVPKVILELPLRGKIKYLILAGLILTLINFFIKPLLKIISFPLKIITLGLITIIINIGIIWLIDIFLIPLEIKGVIPLIWTTLIVWFLSTITDRIFSKKLI